MIRYLERHQGTCPNWRRRFYPFELIRAPTLTWLFPGRAAMRPPAYGWPAFAASTTAPRSSRLPAGSWPATQYACSIPGAQDRSRVRQAVDPILGQAVGHGSQRTRPLAAADRARSGERADLRFALHARRVSTGCTNNTVMTVPSHKGQHPCRGRARHHNNHQIQFTLASQLRDAKEPMRAIRSCRSGAALRPPLPTQSTPRAAPRAHPDPHRR
jgi:hypothetical protein